MKVADRAFQQLFKHLFVYNMLFEDTEVDERFLGVGTGSRLLGISGAGCGIANHLSRHPDRVDAVDINGRHLAITALKTESAREVSTYEEFYRLWGYGKHDQPEKMAGRITANLPKWIQKHWRSNYRLFSRSFHRQGLTAEMLSPLRKMTGVDATWLRSMIPTSTEERRRAIMDRFAPVLRTPWVSALLRSPVNLLALGVNHAQCERILRTEGMTDVVEFLILHLTRVAETDLERNWFIWFACAGHYNHALPDAVAPFARRDHYEEAHRSKTEVRYHHRNIFDVLKEAGPNTWTHYTLCDAPDWMPQELQDKLFREIRRTSKDGAVVLYRSVETDSIVERVGQQKHFKPMQEAIETATALDRTKQYRRVAFYQVQH